MEQSTTCFLIDDDEDDQEIFAIALADADSNSRCLTAGNGKTALQKFEEDKLFIPDYIFLDLNMPVMDGKQCLQEIKIIPRLSGVPVIIYTTSSNQRDVEETKRLGASHFLIKPPSIDQLAKLLAQIIQNRPLPFLCGNVD